MLPAFWKFLTDPDSGPGKMQDPETIRRRRMQLAGDMLKRQGHEFVRYHETVKLPPIGNPDLAPAMASINEVTADLVRQMHRNIEAHMVDLFARGVAVNQIRIENHADGSVRVIADGVPAARFFIDCQGLEPDKPA